MNTTMEMPLTAQEFIDNFKFKDHKEVYTNGAELISVLRVRQMLDHYYARRTQNMTFSEALEAVKAGLRVARKGWNGKEQFVFLAQDLEFRTNADLSAHDGMEIFVHDALAFMGTHGLQVGWLASQADMLSDDWHIVE